MDQVLAKALKRRLELEKELAKLNQFIHMYREFEGTNREAVDTEHNPDAPPFNFRAAAERVQETAAMIRPRGRPADFARIMEGILKDVGRPLQRGQLVEEVEKRGHSIPSDDKPRYLGTILWRNAETFESVDGQGYWLKGVELPYAWDDPDKS